MKDIREIGMNKYITLRPNKRLGYFYHLDYLYIFIETKNWKGEWRIRTSFRLSRADLEEICKEINK